MTLYRILIHTAVVGCVWGTMPGSASASLIDTVTGGPLLAGAKLQIDGINLGVNGGIAGVGVIATRPWVFMFADGTPAPQVFRSDVAVPPRTVAANSATSAGFLGTGTSSALARSVPFFLRAVAGTVGIASSNALAGVGTTAISARTFRTALTMHLASIAIDPLSAPNVPIPQAPPPAPSTFVPFDPSFVPAEDTINAYLQNADGDIYSLFHLDASLRYDSSDGLWDDLSLSVTGPGGTSSSLVTPSDFTFFDHGSSGSGFTLDDPSGINLTIPFTLPDNFVDMEFTDALEIEAQGASSNPAPEPASWLTLASALLVLAACRFPSYRH